MANLGVWLIVGLIAVVIAVIILANFYQRGTREVSLVRTGVGGRKVVLDGGVLAVPYFHDVARVNMQTLRLEVKREGNASLITRDRLRVDVGVEFYVSVLATRDGVAQAAQTLGNRTFQADRLRELIEGKLVDALRSVAATFTMDELHEKRGEFVSLVRDQLVPSLERNGLALDSVSLTDMDQTPFGALDENNAFNAEGMRKLAEVIARSRKDRANIDADADVSVRRSALEVAKRKLDLDYEEEQARIDQVQKIETLKAAQMAEVAARKADSEKAAAQARIDMESAIRSADIAREQRLREAEIERDRLLEAAELKRQLALELLQQDRDIQLHEKSREERQAEALAEEARALVVKAMETVATEKALAEAERRKRVAEVNAEQEAGVSGIRIRRAAEAEKAAAADRAQARLEQARGEQEARTLASEAARQEALAAAEGRKAMVEAENTMNERMAAYNTEKARLEAMPKIVAEMVRPAEKIDSIRIHQINGLAQRGDAPVGSREARPVVNQALDSIMDMAVQLPALRRLGEELGLSMDSGLDALRGDDAEDDSSAKAQTGGKKRRPSGEG
ncbi:flotillin [Natronospirillum operosum]|uniref:Flotillin n=1 Tax=Natronospirillum operosum TaxID=2759953 RepID=A0A4Z0WBT3_9GAMM|nr:flotillin domain-containing protein [Natronospirillum operosum]TGG93383.1 flotillin [Natronospirillum operosum]